MYIFTPLDIRTISGVPGGIKVKKLDLIKCVIVNEFPFGSNIYYP